MSRQRSLLSSVLVLIVAPAVVAVAVTLLVLSIWDRQQGPSYIMLPTYSGTALIPPRESEGEAPLAGDAAGADEGAPAGESTGAEEVPAACENPVHSVASGETLGAIAEAYDVAMDDVIIANQMIDPEFTRSPSPSRTPGPPGAGSGCWRA